MSSVERKTRTPHVLSLAVGGCGFQPMYAHTNIYGSDTSLADALRDVDVASISGRVGNELRNDLIYELTGGQGNREGAPYRLTLVANVTSFSPVLDPQSGRSTAQMIAFDVVYKLHDVVRDEIVLTEKALARVSIDTSSQLYASLRARRDAENRGHRRLGERHGRASERVAP